MKKNFLKKLAFTMAFATVFTTLAPAAGVFAASKPSLNVGKKLTLLLGTEREEFDINVKNKVSGSKYEWTTSNKKVATVDKAGVVEGQAVGSAKVTLKITLPTKKTATLSTTVDVKDNIKEVAISNPAKEAIKVGAEYNFNRTIVETFGGNTTAHKGAITRWEIISENKDKATIDESGIFVATEAGEYEIVAKSFQSKAKYADYLDGKNTATATSESTKITVKPSMLSAKQLDANTVQVTLDSPVADASKFEVSSLVGTTKVKQIVKEVKLDDSKKVATIALYVPFAKTTTYVINYPELNEVTFVAATQNVEDVTAIVIETKEAVINKETEVKVKLLNKDGVDITTPELLSRVSLTSSSDRAFFYGNKLNMSTLGDVTTITAKFHTYTYDASGNEIINITASAPIVCVATPSVVGGTISAYTVVKSTATPDFAKPVQKLAVGDSGYKLFVETVKTDGKKLASQDDYLFTFESSNDNVLIVAADGSLHPVAQGSVTVIVKYDKAIVGAVTVTVVPKRTVVGVELSTTHVNMSNTLNETKKVTITVKDQLDSVVVGEKVKVEKVSTNLLDTVIAEGTVLTDSNGKVELEINALAKAEGTYTYKITVGNIVRTVSVAVAKPSDTVARQTLEVSNTEFDTAIKSGSVVRNVEFNIYDVASNGVNKNNVTTSTAYEIVVVDKDNNEKATTKTSTGVYFSLVTVDATKGEYVKAEEGRYKVVAYKITDGKRAGIVDVKYFTVTDSQKAPTLTKVNGLTSKAATVEAAVYELFEIKLDDKNYSNATDVVKVNYSGSETAGRAYVYSVEVRQVIDTVSLIHTVEINRSIVFE